MRTSSICFLALFSLLAAPACDGSGDGPGGGGSGGSGGSGAAGGSGGAGGTGGSAACEVPATKLALSLLDGGSGCAMDEPGDPVNGDMLGIFTATADGFQVESASLTKVITPEKPAIPDGTFVHLRHGCNPGFHGGAGAWVLLENVDSLDGTPNPTEAGTRLWFFMTAGGEAYNTPDLPFTLEAEQECMDGTIEDGFESPQKVHVTGAGADVVVPPGQSAEFEATSGPHAGKYLFENVNWTFIGYAGGDATSNINVRLSRAD